MAKVAMFVLGGLVGSLFLPFEAQEPPRKEDGLIKQAASNSEAVPPIGSVIAWHMNPGCRYTADRTYVPGPSLPLPSGWMNCDGKQEIPSDSPLYKLGMRRTPDLNTERRFLRGGINSGVLQEDQLQTHTHLDAGHQHNTTNDRIGGGGSNGLHPNPKDPCISNSTSTVGNANLGDPTDSKSGAGEPRHGKETRPVNSSMVWIIRVK